MPPPSAAEQTCCRGAIRRVERVAGPHRSNAVAVAALDGRVVGAVLLAVVAALGEALAAVVTGRVAAGPTAALVWALAVLVLGQAVLDTIGALLVSSAAGRAESRVRARLLGAVVRQPLPVLEEQPVGELLERIDADPVHLAALARTTGWLTLQSALRIALAWVVAGLLWWPSWVLFPVVGAVALLASSRLAPIVAERRIAEQVEWTAHTAQLEEAMAASDDVRTSLGQSYVTRRYAEQATAVLRRVKAISTVSAMVTSRTTLVLSGSLAGLVVVGSVLVRDGRWQVADLVTLWLLVGGFVAQLTFLSTLVPRLQGGLGALTRMRSLLHAPAEPIGGTDFPDGPCEVEFRGLSVGYPGGFSLQDLHLRVPAGTSCAVVGRSGAGKSTLVKALVRALDTPSDTTFVAGADVTTLDVEGLRGHIGVVTQRTDVLDATLRENITLFAEVDPEQVTGALDALGLSRWVQSLPDGLDTALGSGGVQLSAGERQLVAFARLLVRDVSVVVLDEASARMDPRTARLVTEATQRLLVGRTALIVAHRLATVRDCDAVAVLDAGSLVQQGTWADLATQQGPFRDLLTVADSFFGLADGDPSPSDAEAPPPPVAPPGTVPLELGGRHLTAHAARPSVAVPWSLWRNVVRLLLVERRWGVGADAVYFLGSLVGAHGIVTGLVWGHTVQRLQLGSTAGSPLVPAVLLAAGLLVSPLLVAVAVRSGPSWRATAGLRLRLAVLRGQTDQDRLTRVPTGEATGRALDSDRLVEYSHRWVDVALAVSSVVLTGLIGWNLLAGVVTGTVLLTSALVAGLGTPLTRAAAEDAGNRRARFGGSLATALEAASTVKLAGASEAVQRRLREADRVRVRASVHEQGLRTVLGAIPAMLMWSGVLAAWILYLHGVWDLATALLVSTAVGSFGWFGTTVAAVVTEAPAARTWVRAASALAGQEDLVTLPAGTDLGRGTTPAPTPAGRVPLRDLQLRGFSAVHDDGTVGVTGVDLTIRAGSLVLLLGPVGSGKSSLLAALAGLLDHTGGLQWNGVDVRAPQLFLRPGQVSYVAQVPRVLSGSFADNVALDHDRDVTTSLGDAQLMVDVRAAGGVGTVIGTRGNRLSGGQLQRLATARALATGADLLVADDISSALDASTETALWAALRQRNGTVIGSSSRRSALRHADLVVVLEAGRVVASGPWSELEPAWHELAD